MINLQKKIMKLKVLILLLSYFLLGSQFINPQSRTGGLQVIDISNTKKKEIRLQDIADIEYIALETTDDILLSDNSMLSYVSDKYIVVYELGPRGDIFVFNRNGKIVTHFNHRGSSSWEYPAIGGAGAIFDEKNEEIFVCSQSIQVYSLSGAYKRTLKINTIQFDSKVYNFDDETLLVYDDIIIDPYFKGSPNRKPYRNITKKDGSEIAVLDINLPKRLTNKVGQMTENKMITSKIIYFPNNQYYGQDFVIADISSDTMYLLTQKRELTPLLVRRPSVHASEPRKVWTTLLTTDKFILLGIIPLDFSNNNRGGRIPVLMYEFKTGEIYEMSIRNNDSLMERWGPGTSVAIAKNMTADLMWPPRLKEFYRMKQLRGDFEKFVATLNEDDNPIVRIIKFKQ
jgi:hypothetical protein